MVKKSKLLAALDAHKGRDYESERKKKQLKAGEKRKRAKTQNAKGDLSENDKDDEAQAPAQNGTESKSLTTKLGKPTNNDDFANFSDSEPSDGEKQEDQHQSTTILPQPSNGETLGSPSASEADPDSDIPLSDLSEDDRADTIPHQRLTINNASALLASSRRIRPINPSMRFSAHNSLISPLPPASTSIPDPHDDLNRELEFYRICREAATDARKLLRKEGIPFTRPSDYFAEMVKSDEHMGLVKKKMYDQAAGKKAASEARALRDAKKFGKAVQVAKEQERAKEKRQTLDKISSLKRKRQGQEPTTVNEPDDLFESIAVEDSTKNRSQSEGKDGLKPGFKRQKRDQKFGFGGKKRFAKSGDAESSADMRGFSTKRMKTGGRGGGRGGSRGGSKRLGKSRRVGVGRG